MPEHYHRPFKTRKKETIIKKVIIWGFIAFIIVCATGASLFAFYAFGSPKLTRAKLESVKSSIVYDSADKPVYTAGVEDRTYVPISKVSKTYLNALVSVEDRHFYQNNLGIDPLRIVVAGFRNVTGGGASGASTLTQQLIKLSFYSTDAKDRTIRRKAQEAWLAMQLEQNYTKDQILEFYVNKVYLGNSVYGVETASRYYFGKNNRDLTLDQAASLAGLSNLPSNQEPYLHPQAFMNRRNVVLKAMLNNEKITQNEYQNAINTDTLKSLVAKADNDQKRSINMAIDPYIKETLDEVKKLGYDPFADGLKIYTNLNSNLQSKAYELVNDDPSVRFPDDQMQVGLTIIDPTNGHVLAQIGGRKQQKIQFGINRAVQTSRSVGSTIKPLLDYAPAIEYLKYSTFQQMSDQPFNYPGTDTAVHNWDNEYMGSISLRVALASSRNIPAVKTLQAVGIKQATDFVKNLGLKIPAKDQVYSEAIGGSFSSLQMAGAYSALANNGIYHEPTYVTKIVLPDGRVRQFSGKENKAMFPATAYMITDVLKDSFKYGNGEYGVTPNIYDAAKTGSTNYDESETTKNPALAGSGIAKDNWFDGYSKDYSISIWTGYDDPIKGGLNYEQQAIAGAIYQKLMNFLYENKASQDWKKPSNVENVRVLKGIYPPVAVSSGGVSELFLSGTQPKAPIGSITNGKEQNKKSKNDQQSESTSSETSSSSSSQISQNSESESSSSMQSSEQSNSSSSQNTVNSQSSNSQSSNYSSSD
ncbi:transglycosylase domain-containing protein [Xylocopilactobacillus apicola]|uniref:Penicillin-binding protein 1A n=1 Tax=Xylocopilactobacillus apicola TaxID=2932184 RepID=A0AAU9DR41_9LACO|nr:transglycosylase domain-containing protein [Xylocopilactobacillus apicola]BDR58384.1 penicillin-binding protein 1A [Xylocopilactobacillus apicola]